MLAQSGHRAPTGDWTMHSGHMKSPHLPQPKLEVVAGWRRQVLPKVSFVIGVQDNQKNVVTDCETSVGISLNSYCPTQSERLLISRWKTNRFQISFVEIDPSTPRTELDVIRLKRVTTIIPIENQRISIGRSKNITHTGIIRVAINHHTAESFQGLTRTASAGITG